MTETEIANSSEASQALPVSILTRHQAKKLRYVLSDGAKIHIELRYDDECGNKHNSFAITGSYWYPDDLHREPSVCGCIHDIIKQYTPEILEKHPEAPDFRQYIKWHLCGSDAPMHYIANTVFHAGNRDCWGRAPNQPSRFEHGIRFNGSQVTHFLSAKFVHYLQAEVEKGVKQFELVEIEHPKKAGETFEYSPNYSVNDFTDKWHEAPFKNIVEGREFVNALNSEPFEFVELATEFSKGKERDFKAARSCAIAEDLTDEQLSLPKEELTALLKARLPKLMWDFKAAMEELGFIY